MVFFPLLHYFFIPSVLSHITVDALEWLWFLISNTHPRFSMTSRIVKSGNVMLVFLCMYHLPSFDSPIAP